MSICQCKVNIDSETLDECFIGLNDMNECTCLCTGFCNSSFENCVLSDPVGPNDSVECIVKKTVGGQPLSVSTEINFLSSSGNCTNTVINVNQEDKTEIVELKATDIVNMLSEGNNCKCVNDNQITACFTITDETPCDIDYCIAETYCLPQDQGSRQCQASTILNRDLGDCPSPPVRFGSSASKNKLDTGSYIGIAVAGVAVLVGIILMVVFRKKLFYKTKVVAIAKGSGSSAKASKLLGAKVINPKKIIKG